LGELRVIDEVVEKCINVNVPQGASPVFALDTEMLHFP
jgi:hypothetical protein